MGQEDIAVAADEFAKVLAELEYLVTSLDRIGSAGLSADDLAVELSLFLKKGDVFKRLSACRKRLLSALDKHPNELGWIEQELEHVTPWKLSPRT